jgi:hypothetical protein
MRQVRLEKHNATGYIAVMVALGVCGTTAWPDIIVAAILAGLEISGGSQIVRQAMTELCMAATVARRRLPMP